MILFALGYPPRSVIARVERPVDVAHLVGILHRRPGQKRHGVQRVLILEYHDVLMLVYNVGKN